MNSRSPLHTIPLIFILFYGCAEDPASPQVNNTTPVDATFSAIQSRVLTPSCAVSGCHDGGETPDLRSGRSYSRIVNVRSSQTLDYVEPGDPDNSYLLRKIRGVGIRGSRMPRGAPALSQSVTDSISAWIERGALEN